jgi:uncharacterized C2H2 Zn-finger protein
MAMDPDAGFERLSLSGDLSDVDIDFAEPTPESGSASTPATPATSTGGPYCREKRLRCTYEGCGKAFNRPVRLEEHMRTHTNERSLTCQYPGCDKSYFKQSHLNAHVKSAHTKIRNFKCTREGCGKAFTTGQRLRLHQGTHDGSNKYKCTGYPPCDQVFRKRETLQRHVKSTHEHIGPFACQRQDATTGEQCNRSFDTAAKRAQHERTAHAVNQFSCDICVDQDKQAALFATYGELQSHMRSEHPPTCPHCSEPFDTTNELAVHIDLFHSDSQDGQPPAKKARKDRGTRRAPAIFKPAPKVNPHPFGLGDSSAATTAASSAAASPPANGYQDQDFVLDGSMTMYGDSFWGADGHELSFNPYQGYLPAAPPATREQSSFALASSPDVALPQMRSNSDQFVAETPAAPTGPVPTRAEHPVASLDDFIDPRLFTVEAEREIRKKGMRSIVRDS